MGAKMSVLLIDSVQSEHSGVYTCSVQNQAATVNYTDSLHVNVLPRITPFDFESPIYAGEAAQVACMISEGDLPINITWSYEPHPGVSVNRVGTKASLLVIEHTGYEHRGTYSCTATNLAGSSNYSSLLYVNVPPKIVPFSFESPIYAGESTQVTCLVSQGDKPLDIQWFYNTSSAEGISTQNVGNKGSLLLIDSAGYEHRGNYSCRVRNAAGVAEFTALLNVHVPPRIIPFSFEEPIFAGESAQVTCLISQGDSPMNISWKFSGAEDLAALGIAVQSLGRKGSHLLIDAAGSQHRGNYSCFVNNIAGTIHYTTSLNVHVSPKVVPFSFEEPIFAGESAQVTCLVSQGDEPLEISWKLSSPYNITDFTNLGIVTQSLGRRGSTLLIESAESKHRGNYTCVVTNKAATTLFTTVLNVHVPPRIVPFSFEEPIFAGQSIQVACSVSAGDAPIQIGWKLSGVDIPDDFGIETQSLGRRGSALIFESADSKHGGNYTCSATNAAGTVHYTATLNVHVPPRIVPFSFEEPIFAGQAAQVSCLVSEGDAPIRISWQFANTDIPDDFGVEIANLGKRGSALIFESADARHRGNYTCLAANSAATTQFTTVLNVHVSPRIVPFSFEEPIFAGQSAQVTCLVSEGDAPLQFSWQLSGQEIPKDGGIEIQSLGRRGSNLMIEYAESKHGGNYTCSVSNTAGTVQYTTVLNVHVQPRIVPFSFEEPIFAGQAAQVTCLVSEGDLPIDISWTFHGTIDMSELGVSINRIRSKTSMLLIDTSTGQHQGNYTCIAKNKAGITQYTTTLHVHVPPRWILEPSDKAFAQGSDAKVECKADGFPKPQVTWKKAAGNSPGDYKDLRPNNPDVKVEDGTLYINNIQKNNQGYYLCEAVNGIGSGLSAVITISPLPSLKSNFVTRRPGEENPAYYNVKLRERNQLSDNRYTIREEILPNGVLSDLSIKRTERGDSALFTCVATNAFGSDDSSINLIVQEVPEVPYGLKILDKSGKTVQLSWVAPYDGNSPIKRYIIEYKISKGTWEKDIDRVLVPGEQTLAGVFNLRPAQTYHIRIVAENEIGSSEPSDTVTILTAEEAPSGPPTHIKVEATDQNTLKVSWSPPERDHWNGVIQGYYVGYKETSTDKPFLFETVDFSKEEGKEHHLTLSSLKTYTQYSVVVQALNKLGPGPMSEEVKQYTAEGTPEQPPQDNTCTTLTSQTIRVSWVSPPLITANGVIKGYKVVYGPSDTWYGYKVVYGPSDTWYDENTKDTKITPSSETILHGLKKFTNYSMQILAYTSGGDGVKSAPIHCQTEQDVPEAPAAIKALVMSGESILVSWKPPLQPNGQVIQYTVYVKEEPRDDSSTAVPEIKSQKISSQQMTYEASGLKKKQNYIFYVTASTNIGEGQPSKNVTLSPSNRVPARIASFNDNFTATYTEDIKLPCLTVGVPAPEIIWKVKGVKFESNDRMRQLPEGSLLIKTVTRSDAGEYSCSVQNSFGVETVTHQLIVHAPPYLPQVQLTTTTTNSITMKLKPHPNDKEPIHGYTVRYKPEFGDWDTVQVPATAQKYTLENLMCGSRYQISVTAIGTGDESETLNTKTKGSKPIIPDASRFIEVSSNSITLHMMAWSDGGCPMLFFVVENKKKIHTEWNQLSNNFKPGGKFIVLDLDPATWYNLRVTAHNNAGFSVAEYEYATLTITGGTVAPSIITFGSADDTFKVLMANLNLVVPAASAIVVIIVAFIVICFLRGKDSDQKGTIMPPFKTSDFSPYLPWVPGWIDWNAVVPIGATVIVVFVGLLVVCFAVSRRKGDGQTRLRDDIVYNQSMVGGMNTVDKRHINEELGYIAPPNRKLPPVPGSNYNTCDRIKRGHPGSFRNHCTWDPRGRHMYEELESQGGAYLGPRGRLPPCPGSDETLYTRHRGGMEDEICPYATFHLLGFREEMDPASKAAAMNFQTFPHQNGGHTGTLGSPPMQANGHLHQRSGSQSMPRNGGRYSRIGPNSIYAGPEYDDPANCQEDPYEPYGAPYDHYGSRNSVGRRSFGSSRNIPTSNSPEPPPPPPRNHDPNSSGSANDSKESNEISEAECDRDQLVTRNYAGMRGSSKDGLTTEEMRKLIERNEIGGYQHQNGGLTTYDTVAV
ncbi:hypothetical protein M8J75_000409 [Diaphorina citri]|nr:hypothetical protein M8J75_000409 [Diaphorina citri]